MNFRSTGKLFYWTLVQLIIYKIIDSTGNIDARYLFYLSQVILSGNQIESLLRKGKHVLVESYVYRTITYHEGVGSSLTFTPAQFDIPTPDKIFYLRCDDSQRVNRINNRNKRIGFWNELAETYKAQIEDKYVQFMESMVVIDNSTNEPQKTVDKIISHL
ncbi:hypothetical protein HC766_04165 [Candidatus Gracilibacteria bacterium]|nr:hypothetical protein [Candidatus Gracilibacteria bacterium]NJS41522.1 hypothetical protein [Candidatus Gracilibacteria bacterium]